MDKLGAPPFLGALPLLKPCARGADGHSVLVLAGWSASEQPRRAPLRSFLKSRARAVQRLAPGPKSRPAAQGVGRRTMPSI